MSTLERYTVSDGNSVIVAIPDEAGIVPTSTRASRVIADAVGSLGEALAPVRAAADEAIRSLREMTSEPSRIEIQIGVCLTAQATAIIASAQAGAQMTITVAWERPDGK